MHLPHHPVSVRHLGNCSYLVSRQAHVLPTLCPLSVFRAMSPQATPQTLYLLPLALACLFSWGVAMFYCALSLTGDIIYNKTDGAGCQFYAICNQYCDVDRFQGTCPSSSPPMSSTTVPLPPLLPGCDNAIPPRQVSFPSPSSSLQGGVVWGCQGQLLWG